MSDSDLFDQAISALGGVKKQPTFSADGTYGTPPQVLKNLAQIESSGNPLAVNKDSGAMGLMQFLPSTLSALRAQGVKFDPLDPKEATAAADYYLSQLTQQNGGDLSKALAQYGGFKTKDPTDYVTRAMAGVTTSQPDPYAGHFDEAIKALSSPNTPPPPKAVPAPEKLTWLDRALGHLPDWMASDPASRTAAIGTTLGRSMPGQAVAGLIDPGLGIVQNAAHVLPGDSSAIDQRVKGFEEAYQKARGSDSLDLPRIGGQVATSLALPGASGAGEGANIVNRLIAAARAGGIVGTANTVSDPENFWTEKAKQAGLGVLGGLVGQGVIEGAAKVGGSMANWAYNAARSLFTKEGDLIPQAAAKASPELQAAVQKQVAGGGKVSPEALGRQLEADSLGLPPLSRGQASGDPALISHELNTRGNTGFSYHLNDQAKAAAAKLDDIRANVAPDTHASADNLLQRGNSIYSSVAAADAADKAAISALYKKLADANGGKFPVDGIQFADNAKAALEKQMKGRFVPPEVQGLMDDFASGKPMTFENFENLRTILGTAERNTKDGNVSGAIGIVRNALEDLPMSGEAATVKPLADAARQAAKDRFDKIAETPALKAVVDGKDVGDTFVQKYIVGGTSAGIRNLAAHLKNDPEGLQNIKAGVVDYLKGQSVNQNGEFVASKFNTALTAMKDKLGTLFNADEIGQLQTLGNYGRYTQSYPKGNFVNTSNTDVANAARGLAAAAVDHATGTPIGSVANRVASWMTPTAKLSDMVNPGAGTVIPSAANEFLTRTLPAQMGKRAAVPLASLLSQYPDQVSRRADNR